MKSLFEEADSLGIKVIYRSIPINKSMALENNVCLDYSLLWRGADERVHLAHELGHCATGSFYNRYTPFDIRQKHENRADKWAIKKLISREALNDAVSRGNTTLWELAEYFGVTNDFMRKAICLYEHENLADQMFL